MRRTKRDMESMQLECRYYLLQSNNDPHKAYDNFIKYHLENKIILPYYIKGIKDFIKVSQQVAIELNRKEQMKQSDRERTEEKEEIINYILNLSKDDIKAIYKQYKDKVSHSDKLVIHDVYFTIWSNYEITKKDIDQHTINVFTNIYNDQLQTA